MKKILLFSFFVLISSSILSAQARQVKTVEPTPSETDASRTDMSRAIQAEPRLKDPGLKTAKQPHYLPKKVDMEATSKNLSKLCPPPAERFYRGDFDNVGFCGYANDTSHCKPHYIYVPFPNGSIGQYQECPMVWGGGQYMWTNTEEITGGYACMFDISNPLYTTPAPANACPNEVAHLWGPGSLFEYVCLANEMNVPLVDYDCLPNYKKAFESKTNGKDGRTAFYTCGLVDASGEFVLPIHEGLSSEDACGKTDAIIVKLGTVYYESYCCGFITGVAN